MLDLFPVCQRIPTYYSVFVTCAIRRSMTGPLDNKLCLKLARVSNYVFKQKVFFFSVQICPYVES